MENILKNWKNFGNFWEKFLKKYEKAFQEIRSKFGVTSKKT